MEKEVLVLMLLSVFSLMSVALSPTKNYILERQMLDACGIQATANISRMQWQSSKDHVLRGYDFAYDGSFDFKDGADADVEYFYDANGALVKDLNKGISNIEYDVLGNLYGHAYFYELKQKNPSIEPSHTFGVVGYVKEFDPYFNQVVSYPVFGKNNTELEEQINIVEQQAIDNYEKNNR